MSEITIFQAAICRDLSEGGDGTKYFGSTAAYGYHVKCAQDNGLLEVVGDDEVLTKHGQILGSLCQSIPDNRAYAFTDKYQAAIAEFQSISKASGKGE